MRNHWKIMLALTVAVTAATAPARAQNALADWTVQNRDNGARTLTPPDLQAGEIYSVTVHNAQPLGGQSLEKWLRAFVGPVGTTPGSLVKPIRITTGAQSASGIGVYNGPNGTSLNVAFAAVSLDNGASVSAMRTLFTSYETYQRYKTDSDAILQAMIMDAREQLGAKFVYIPPAVSAQIKPGGAVVPGVYAGNLLKNGAVTERYRLYIYANGESRMTDRNDADLKGSYGSVEGVGKYKYYQGSGQIDLEGFTDVFNTDDKYAFYGRDSAGKAKIVAGNTRSGESLILTYAGQPTKRPSPATVRAREIEDARFKWVTAPGKGVQNAQIAALVNDYVVQFDGMSSNITNDTYLLLKDGTITNLLPVPPDQLDAVKSRQNEPKRWGKWRATNHPNQWQISIGGAPFQTVNADKAEPALAQTKLNGNYVVYSSSSDVFGGSYGQNELEFTSDGRFSRGSSGGSYGGLDATIGGTNSSTTYDDNGTTTSAQSGNGLGVESRQNNPRGDRAGKYTLSGYTMTLRTDNGKVERLPFLRFFGGSSIWFEGQRMTATNKSPS